MSSVNPARGQRPLVGITVDVTQSPEGRLKADCGLAYATCVVAAGGEPVLLPPLVERVPEYARRLEAFVLTGGDDPRMEVFGVPTHPRAKVMHPLRQEFELALLDELRAGRPEVPVLGVCLGMQLMSLHAGGTLNQYLPDTLPTHGLHSNAEHRVAPVGGCGAVAAGKVWSNHRQAVEDAGRLAVVARSEDGIIEAIADPLRRFYVGVQWHPERTSDPATGPGVFEALIRAARH